MHRSCYSRCRSSPPGLDICLGPRLVRSGCLEGWNRRSSNSLAQSQRRRVHAKAPWTPPPPPLAGMNKKPNRTEPIIVRKVRNRTEPVPSCSWRAALEPQGSDLGPPASLSTGPTPTFRHASNFSCLVPQFIKYKNQ